MNLWTAFVVGFFGSLHCAGMCGPLVLAYPAVGGNARARLLGRIANHLGRIATYGMLGLVFGMVGRTLALAGLQRVVSIGAGVVILLSLPIFARSPLRLPVAKLIVPLRSRLAVLLRNRTLGGALALGALNGLLPCGLVYVACAAATATGGVLSAISYMLAFGAGTVPMLLTIGSVGRLWQPQWRLRFQKLIPASLAMLAFLLILRGMALGIPFLSPDLASGHCPACH